VQPNTMLDAALRYAKAGWPVFPCVANRKVPATPNGFLDATTGRGQIEAWWGYEPRYNIAIATGFPGPDVVDFDVKNVDGEEAYHRLAAARMLAGGFLQVITPSGGGHMYFAGTEQHNGSLAKVGVDFRSKGGYVLAPPSHVVEVDDLGVALYEDDYVLLRQRAQTGVTIEWQKIKDFLVPPAAPRVEPGHGPIAGSPSSRINGALEAMRKAEPGERNHLLFWAASRLVECDASSIDYSDLFAAAQSVGLPADEIEKTIRSARR
jgi:hypothetical protein